MYQYHITQKVGQSKYDSFVCNEGINVQHVRPNTLLGRRLTRSKVYQKLAEEGNVLLSSVNKSAALAYGLGILLIRFVQRIRIALLSVRYLLLMYLTFLKVPSFTSGLACVG